MKIGDSVKVAGKVGFIAVSVTDLVTNRKTYGVIYGVLDDTYKGPPKRVPMFAADQLQPQV